MELDIEKFTESETRENQAIKLNKIKDVLEAGGGGGDAVTWGTLPGKPATFPPTIGTTATTALAGNTELLAIGTTAATAKAGNYQPTYAQVTGKPATFPPTIGTTATTAMAGNTPIPDAATWANLTGKPATFPPTIGTSAATAKAGNWTPAIADVTGLQDALDALDARIAALETPAG